MVHHSLTFIRQALHEPEGFALRWHQDGAPYPWWVFGALALMAIAVWQITGDGEAAAFEGFALIALYVVLAALTLYE